MSDREALLSAIRTQPDEDTPRLMYADWLDENGDGKRAAYIRSEVAHQRMITADNEANAVSDFLDTQYSTGLNNIKWRLTDADLGARLSAEGPHGKAKFRLTAKGERLPSVKGVLFNEDRRGFYDYADVSDAGAFLKHAEAIFAATPLTRVSFDRMTAEQAEELAGSGYLARLRELTLGEEVPAEAVRVLGSHKDAAVIRKLEFETSWLNAEIVEALAEGKHWTGLEFLDIVDSEDSEDPPSAEEFADLFSRRQFRNLRKLAAWGCQLNDEAVKAIARNMPELRFLDVALNQVTGEGVAAIAASKALRNLRYLDVSSCEVTDGTAAADLITTSNLPNLTVLRLDGNEIRALSAKLLERTGRAPVLRVLDLGRVRMGAPAAEALAKCPSLRGLWYFAMTPDTAPQARVRFFQHAAFEKLTALDLSYDGIDADAAKALAAWPGAASLQWLDLAGNNIGEKGAKALANSPHLGGLKYIRTTGRGVALLKRRFKKAFG